jgi:predicted DNA-binding transcriptional regulator AlpA
MTIDDEASAIFEADGYYCQAATGGEKTSKTRQNQDQQSGKSLLVGAPAIATLVGKSTRTVNRWIEAGTLPPPVTSPTGGPRMWKRRDIEDWVAAGCDLKRWRRDRWNK